MSAIESERAYTGSSGSVGKPRHLTYSQANLLLAMVEHDYEPVHEAPAQ